MGQTTLTSQKGEPPRHCPPPVQAVQCPGHPPLQYSQTATVLQLGGSHGNLLNACSLTADLHCSSRDAGKLVVADCTATWGKGN